MVNTTIIKNNKIRKPRSHKKKFIEQRAKILSEKNKILKEIRKSTGIKQE